MRTWDENRDVINQFWPTEWNPEETKLMREDLSPLNQDVLYDAIRNVKRKHDTPFVHLKWITDEYRQLDRVRRLQSRSSLRQEPREIVEIDEAQDLAAREQLREWIDTLTPSQWSEGVAVISDKAANKEICLATGFRLGRYLNERLGMSNGGSIS